MACGVILGGATVQHDEVAGSYPGTQFRLQPLVGHEIHFGIGHFRDKLHTNAFKWKFQVGRISQKATFLRKTKSHDSIYTFLLNTRLHCTAITVLLSATDLAGKLRSFAQRTHFHGDVTFSKFNKIMSAVLNLKSTYVCCYCFEKSGF